jgi:hypothetical protein
MKNATNSIYVQAIYMFIAGTGFLLMPNTVLPMFGMAPVEDVWIRVLGLVVLVFGFYYFEMAKNQVLSYYRASVWGRFAVSAGLVALAVLKIGEMPLLLFAAVDTGLAIWTYTALKQEVKS